MLVRYLLQSLLLWTCLCLSTVVRGQSVGKPLAGWQPGYLDIHQISTGRGNATFFILPDGTTLLVDAGSISPLDWRTGLPRQLPTHPDSSRRAGEWIARYIRRVLPAVPNPVIDYAILTHFHDDHIGSPILAPRKSTTNYALTGIAEVAEFIPVRTILDRGWPDYTYPRPLNTDSMVVNYRRFLDWQVQHNQMTVERFLAGRANQIKLLKQPKQYEKLFQIRNISVNGELWTGKNETTRQLFPTLDSLLPAQFPTENGCSVALRVRYGQFDYFLAGDIPGILKFGEPAWHDLETPISKIAGRVDVYLLNHHGYEDSQNNNLLTALQPRVLIIPAWDTSHPARSVLERVYSDEVYTSARDVFTTQLLPQTTINLGDLQKRLTSKVGHVLVRVMPGGRSYVVLIVDDTNESMQVKAIHGPYKAR